MDGAKYSMSAIGSQISLGDHNRRNERRQASRTISMRQLLTKDLQRQSNKRQQRQRSGLWRGTMGMRQGKLQDSFQDRITGGKRVECSWA